MHYDMDGNQIDMWQWVRLLERASQIEPGQPGSRFLAQDEVELPGGEKAHVSTVWLGIDYSFGERGAPLIFETMIFWESGNYGSDDYCVRTPSKASALAEHDQAIEWARNLGQLPQGYRVTEDRSTWEHGGPTDEESS